MHPFDERLRELINAKVRKPIRKPKQLKQKKRKGNYSVDPTRLGELSESELVAIAHILDYDSASRQYLREDLIAFILGDMDEFPEDVLTEVREVIFAYLESHNVQASQMPCDMHCPTCPHHMVMACYTANRDLVEGVEPDAS